MGRAIAPLRTRLADGRPVTIRALRPSDRVVLAAGLLELSPHARTARFLQNRTAFSDAELDYLTRLDQVNHLGLIATVREPTRSRPVAVGRAIRTDPPPEPTDTPGDHVAEVALTVLDAYQRLGIGTLLLARLADLARAVGITHFDVVTAHDNRAMERLAKRFGGTVIETEPGLKVRRIRLDRIGVELDAGYSDTP